MKIKDIKTKKPFNSIFDINDNLVNIIKEDIEINGYDDAFPLVVWNNVVIDGHTRLIAAKQAEITEIPIIEYEFETEDDALEYAIHNQRDRRNLTPAELLRCVEALDKKKEKGGNKNPNGKNQYIKSGQNLEPNFDQTEPTRKETAETIGVGQSTISNIRSILDDGNTDTKKKVEKGDISIDQAAKQTRQEKKQKKEQTKTTFNKTNENIEWAKWTWNPITGCKHNCNYCYARDIANRFYEQGFEPHFYPERLNAPENTKIPKNRLDEEGIKNVFLVSMGDMFGNWIPTERIEKILKKVEQNQQWNFLILTKNPKRYLEFEFPKNVWLGATAADSQKQMDKACEIFKQINHPIKFISCEPLMDKIDIPKDPGFNWLIIGGRSHSTGMEAGQPKWEWVENLFFQARENNIKIYFKPNLEIRPKEYPKQLSD